MFHGRDFQIRLEGRLVRVGFYTTRVVDASGLEAAERKALAAVREKLRPRVVAEGMETGRIVVDTIATVTPHDNESRSTGFVWYPMDGEEADSIFG